MSYDKVIIAHFPNQNKITELSFMYFFQFMGYCRYCSHTSQNSIAAGNLE
jgi:hypothetical protein